VRFFLSIFLFCSVVFQSFGLGYVTVINISQSYSFYGQVSDGPDGHSAGAIYGDNSAGAFHLAPGETARLANAHANMDPPVGWGTSIRVYWDASGAPGPGDGATGGAEATYYVGAQDCITNLTFSLRNTSILPIGFVLADRGTPDLSTFEYIKPQGLYFHTKFAIPCNEATNWTVGYMEDDDFHKIDYQPIGSSPYETPGSSTNFNAESVNPPTPAQGIPQTNILWSAGSGTNVIQTVKDGSSVLFDAMVKSANLAHEDAQQINKSVNGLSNRLSIIVTNTSAAITNGATEGTLRGLTNLIGNLNGNSTNVIQGTNSQSLSNIATETTLNGISNLLSSFSTNSLTNGAWASSMTNSDAATAAATEALGDYGIQSVIDAVGSPSIPEESHSAPDMTVSIHGVVFNLDPLATHPQWGELSVCIWEIILISGFVFFFINRFWDILKMRSGQALGSVPNLYTSAFGWGTNLLALAVKAAVTLAFIAIWALSMSFLWSYMAPYVAELSQYDHVVGCFGSIGYYLLCGFFPIHLCFVLLTTKIFLDLMLAKIVAIASTASRYLVS